MTSLKRAREHSMAKNFMDDTAKTSLGVGVLGALMEQSAPASSNTVTKQTEPLKEQKPKKMRVSFFLEASFMDELKGFVAFQRTQNNKPYYHQYNAIEDAFQLLYAREKYVPTGRTQD
jgi:hypothetical protein